MITGSKMFTFKATFRRMLWASIIASVSTGLEVLIFSLKQPPLNLFFAITSTIGIFVCGGAILWFLFECLVMIMILASYPYVLIIEVLRVLGISKHLELSHRIHFILGLIFSFIAIFVSVDIIEKRPILEIGIILSFVFGTQFIIFMKNWKRYNFSIKHIFHQVKFVLISLLNLKLRPIEFGYSEETRKKRNSCSYRVVISYPVRRFNYITKQKIKY